MKNEDKQTLIFINQKMNQSDFEKESNQFMPIIRALFVVHSQIKCRRHAEGLDFIHYNIPSLSVRQKLASTSSEDDDLIDIVQSMNLQEDSVEWED